MNAGLKDLGPEGGTLLQKFEGKAFLGDTECLISVALRIARVNHACLPNAAVIYDETACVAILFAQKDIHPFEEISICYYIGFFSLLPQHLTPYPDMNPPRNNVEEEYS